MTVKHIPLFLSYTTSCHVEFIGNLKSTEPSEFQNCVEISIGKMHGHNDLFSSGTEMEV